MKTMRIRDLSEERTKLLVSLITGGHFEAGEYERPEQEPMLTLETLASGVAVGPVVPYGHLSRYLISNPQMLPIVFCRFVKDLLLRDLNRVSGVITNVGDYTSHVVLRAKGLSIPVARSSSVFEYSPNGAYPVLTLIASDTSAALYAGEHARPEAKLSHDLIDAAHVARGIRRVGILANVDNQEDVRDAFELGADGVSMWRTENFLTQVGDGALLRNALLDMLARSSSIPANAEAEITRMFREELTSMLAAARGAPVVVRLLDLPLVELLGRDKQDELPESAKVAVTMDNPLLSIRGARLGIIYPAVADFQLAAVAEAIKMYALEDDSPTDVRILIPLVCDAAEVKWYRERLERLFPQEERASLNNRVRFGATIETPRSALIAFELGLVCDFFSIGTNDLTQYTWALDRDTAQPTVLDSYLEQKILRSSPFLSFDTKAVGVLMKWAVEQGRSSNPNLLVGVTGSYGSDPDLIPTFRKLGIDYVGCPVRRIPSLSVTYAKFELDRRA